eukprot:6485600-Amphidinium_carterae.1
MSYREFGTEKFGGVSMAPSGEGDVLAVRAHRREDFRALAYMIGSCLVKEASAQEKMDGRSEGFAPCLLAVHLLTLVLAVLIAIGVSDWLRTSALRVEYKSEGVQTEDWPTRNVAVQAQCTYKFKWASPRFRPLPDQSEGAWADYGIDRSAKSSE